MRLEAWKPEAAKASSAARFVFTPPSFITGVVYACDGWTLTPRP